MHSFRHKVIKIANQDCSITIANGTAFVIRGSFHDPASADLVIAWIRVNLSSWIRVLLLFTWLFAGNLIFNSAIKIIRLRRWFGLIGNHDYHPKKETRFITIKPHPHEILIILMAKGAQCRTILYWQILISSLDQKLFTVRYDFSNFLVKRNNFRFIGCIKNLSVQTNFSWMTLKTPQTKFRCSASKVIEIIWFSQSRLSSHVLWSINLWRRIFLLPFHLQTPISIFGLVFKRAFRKCTLLPSSTYCFWDRAIWIEQCSTWVKRGF